MPQLDPFIFSSITLFSTFTIISLIFLMHNYIIPIISSSLKLRNKISSISKDLVFHEEKDTKNLREIDVTNFVSSYLSISNNITKKLNNK